jgi:hypothetical protein
MRASVAVISLLMVVAVIPHPAAAEEKAYDIRGLFVDIVVGSDGGLAVQEKITLRSRGLSD